MRTIIIIISTIVLFPLFLSCTKERTSDAVPLGVIDPDTINFGTSMKGWELYSWPNGNDWNHSLVVGTNRLKSYDEVVNSPFRVTGTNMLESMLLRLPEGEMVIWIEEVWLKSIWLDSYYDLQLPDIITVGEVKEFCKNSGITLVVSNE